MEYGNAYNIGIKYLQDKYSVNQLTTCSFDKRLSKARNKKEAAEIIANSTERDFNRIIDKDLIKDTTDKNILLLVEQYYLAETPKKDLVNLLNEIGLA